MSVAQIAGLAFTSEDRVRDVLHNFNADGCASLYPRYAGGHPPRFTLAQRREIMKIAKSASADHGLAFRGGARPSAPTSWSPGVVDDISHDGLRALLRTESISVQAMKTWKPSAPTRITRSRRRAWNTCMRSLMVRSSPRMASPGDLLHGGPTPVSAAGPPPATQRSPTRPPAPPG